MEDGKVMIKKEQAVSEKDEQRNVSGAQDMQVLVSGAIHKDGRTFARVSFLRGRDWAEGIIPDGVIEKSEGFTEEEISGLKDYLAREKDMLIGQAKGVNPLRNMLGM